MLPTIRNIVIKVFIRYHFTSQSATTVVSRLRKHIRVYVIDWYTDPIIYKCETFF